MKSQQLRTIVLSLDTPTKVQTAMDLLRSGLGLTAGQSGLGVVEAIANLELVGQPTVVWDGLYYNVFLFVTSG